MNANSWPLPEIKICASNIQVEPTNLATVAEIEEQEAARTTGDVADTTTGDVMATHDFELFQAWTTLRDGCKTLIAHWAPRDIQVG